MNWDKMLTDWETNAYMSSFHIKQILRNHQNIKGAGAVWCWKLDLIFSILFVGFDEHFFALIK